jgi:hypothetical protein
MGSLQKEFQKSSPDRTLRGTSKISPENPFRKNSKKQE